MLNKEELLAKGNSLIDKINTAMSQIEICESSKEKVASPDAHFAINFYDGNGGFKPYDLQKALPESSIDRIKAFIMTEFDLQTEASMKYLDKLGIAPEVVTTSAGDVYEDSGSDGEYYLPDDVEIPVENKKRTKPTISDAELVKMYNNGMTYEEIALETGMGKSTVARHVKETMDKIKKESASRGKKK